MSREIKFRAWDTRTKRMFPYNFVLFGEVTCFNMIEEWLSDPEQVVEGIDPMLRINDVEIMQFTGMRDSEGREIYEGDVVVRRDERAVIEFLDGAFQFKWFDDVPTVNGITHTYMGGIWTNDWQILGNIHEHPHLLNNEQEEK